MLDLRNDLVLTRDDLSDLRRDFARQIGETDVVEEILTRGIVRGELDAAKLLPRVKAIPIDLAQNEIFLTVEKLPDEAIYEILDMVFLPLARRS